MTSVVNLLDKWENKGCRVFWNNKMHEYLWCDDVEVADGFLYCKLKDEEVVLVLPSSNVNGIEICKDGKKDFLRDKFRG